MIAQQYDHHCKDITMKIIAACARKKVVTWLLSGSESL